MLIFLYYLNNVGLLITLLFLGYGLAEPNELANIYGMEFLIGVYQMLISLVMIFRRKRTNNTLDFHFVLSTLYLLMLAGMGAANVEIQFEVIVGILPWPLALLFTYGIKTAAYSYTKGLKPKADEKAAEDDSNLFV